MKRLPSVFKNTLSKNINNNDRLYTSFKDKNEEINETQGLNVLQKINLIFNSSNYVYKANVEIKLKDRTVIKQIIGKNKTHLITNENELIPITDILDIKKSLK